MSSILDIDLDYFNLIRDPEQRLLDLMNWGNRPIAFIVEKHHKVLPRWQDRVKRGTLSQPSHILHVDEHHDMMDQKRNANIANVNPIDSPEMWLDDAVWYRLAKRFSVSSTRPDEWPKLDIVSICTSPEFIDHDLLDLNMLS